MRFRSPLAGRKFSLLVAVLFFGVCQPLLAFATTTAIRFGTLVDGSGRTLSNAIVVVEADRITSVGPDPSSIPPGANLIDLTDYTGIPGLIDVHTHMTYYWDQTPGTRPWAQLVARTPAVTVSRAQENARKTLEAGVTTVRDLGSFDHMDIAMRDLIDQGAMLGPRMFVAGHGLHISKTAARPVYLVPDRGRADAVPAVMRAVQEQVAAGVDVIKMFGSTGSGGDVTGHQTFTFEEMRAAVDLAHQSGKRIAIHSYGPEAAGDATRAGADSIEHATDLNDATLMDMVRRQTFYVPTIDHNRYYAEHSVEFGYGPEVVRRLQDYLQRNLATARRAHQAGVRFAMGSDAVFTMFGQNTRELRWFVEAGMTPEEALATATTNAAALLDMESSLGAVAPGYYADIVAVRGDPLADVDAVINQVQWVMKGGVVVVDKTKAQN